MLNEGTFVVLYIWILQRRLIQQIMRSWCPNYHQLESLPPFLCSGFQSTWLIRKSRNPLREWIIRSSSRYFRGSTRKHLGTVIVPYVYQRATCCYWILRGIIVCWRYFSLICLMLRKRTSTAGEQVECRSLQLKNAAKSEQNYMNLSKTKSTLIRSNRKLS